MTEKQIHVTYDQFETPVTLHCLDCHTVIARRSEVPSVKNPNVVLHAMVKSPIYREVRVKLSDGSESYLPFCSECAKHPMDRTKAMDVVKDTWEAEMQHQGRPEIAVDEMKEKTASLEIVESEEGNANAG